MSGLHVATGTAKRRPWWRMQGREPPPSAKVAKRGGGRSYGARIASTAIMAKTKRLVVVVGLTIAPCRDSVEVPRPAQILPDYQKGLNVHGGACSAEEM